MTDMHIYLVAKTCYMMQVPPRIEETACLYYMYAYKASADAPCLPGASPILRLKPGGQYKFTFHNTCIQCCLGTKDGIAVQQTGYEYCNHHWQWQDQNSSPKCSALDCTPFL